MSQPIVELDVEVDEYGFTIDGSRFYEFEPGVKYILNSEEDIWAYWYDDGRATTEFVGNTDHLKPVNLTCPEHHKYVSNSILYMQMFRTIANSFGTPVGLIGREIEGTMPSVADMADFDLSEHWNDTILNTRHFLTNGTEEDLFNLEQEDWVEPHKIDVHYDPYTSIVKFFDRSERYLSISLNGKRVDPSFYKPQFISNASSQLIQFKDSIDGHIIFRSDLCHNARQNGSKRVEIIFRDGDERQFYINNFKSSFKQSLVIKGKPAPRDRIYIRQQIDDYIMDRYPELYAFLVSYYDGENIGGEAQSYIRNMIQYTDVDEMPRELLERKLRNVFTPFDTSRVDPRILAKRMVDFFQRKGTEPSYRWLSNALFEKKSELHRFSSDVVRLSYGEWRQYIGLILSQEDLTAMGHEEGLLILGAKDSSITSIVDSLIGHTIVGRTSNTEATVEGYEQFKFNQKTYYRLKCTIVNGKFDQNELIDIRRISNVLNINSSSSKEQNIGIVDFEVVRPGRGYRVGQPVVIKSTTGQGLHATVGHTDKLGGIRSVRVDNQGWYYRTFKDHEVSIFSDRVYPRVEFKYESVEEESKMVATGNLDYVSIRDEVYPVILFPDHVEIAGYKINKGFYAITNSITASMINGEVWFFAKDAVSNKVRVIDKTDTSFVLDFSPTDEIIFIKSNSRTLFIVAGNRVCSFDVAEAISNAEPTLQTFQFFSEHGTLRSLFEVQNETYAFTSTHLLKFDRSGIEVAAVPVDREYQFAEYVHNGMTETLYMASGGDLYAYQWFVENYEAELKPVFGRINTIYEDVRQDRNVWSGHSKLHDNLIYQDFSLGIVLDESTSSYMQIFNEMINTAGFRHWGVRIRDIGSVLVTDMSVERAGPGEFPPVGYEFVQSVTLQNTFENLKSLDEMEREANISALEEEV